MIKRQFWKKNSARNYEKLMYSLIIVGDKSPLFSSVEKPNVSFNPTVYYFNHRVSTDHIYVRMGNNRLYEGNKYKIEKVVIHPDYPGSSRDIAVLKLKEKVTFNTRLKPICMPSGGPEAGLRCYVTGWGRTEI